MSEPMLSVGVDGSFFLSLVDVPYWELLEEYDGGDRRSFFIVYPSVVLARDSLRDRLASPSIIVVVLARSALMRQLSYEAAFIRGARV